MSITSPRHRQQQHQIHLRIMNHAYKQNQRVGLQAKAFQEFQTVSQNKKIARLEAEKTEIFKLRRDIMKTSTPRNASNAINTSRSFTDISAQGRPTTVNVPLIFRDPSSNKVYISMRPGHQDANKLQSDSKKHPFQQMNNQSTDSFELRLNGLFDGIVTTKRLAGVQLVDSQSSPEFIRSHTLTSREWEERRKRWDPSL